jgi:hypothetical protein
MVAKDTRVVSDWDGGRQAAVFSFTLPKGKVNLVTNSSGLHSLLLVGSQPDTGLRGPGAGSEPRV